MIREITISAKECTCEATLQNGSPCGYRWISTSFFTPTHCQNRECRSREWNGVKVKRKPKPKPTIVLPKPVKIRGGNEDES